MKNSNLKTIENEFILKPELEQANFELITINNHIDITNKTLLLQPIIFVCTGFISMIICGSFLTFFTIAVPFCCVTYLGFSRLKYSLQSKKQKRKILKIEEKIFNNEQIIAESNENNLTMDKVDNLKNSSTKNRIAPKREYNVNKDNKIVRKLTKKTN